MAVYHSLGINTPRVSQDQAEWGSNGVNGVKTSMGNLQPGDLVAWYGGEERGQYIGHIAVYAGNGEIIEAYDTGYPVRRRALRGEENGFGVHLYLPGD
jgi:cell wall-associated NlpC family hydrolase